VAEKLPFTYTGADFYALCSDAMLKAVTRQATAVDNKIRAINADPETHHPISTAYYFDHYATPEDIAVMVQEQDFLAANDELIPSVSAGELAHYEHVRATFEGVREKEKDDKPAPVQRAVSGASTSSKGKGKAVASGSSKGKGKGIALTSDDEIDEEDEVDDMNGQSKGKGKAPMGFQDGTASDDDGLY
jgi:peroxin-6